MMWNMCSLISNVMLCDCTELFTARGLPAGLELHQNVLSPEEQLKMVQAIEEWVIQVGMLAHIPAPLEGKHAA